MKTKLLCSLALIVVGTAALAQSPPAPDEFVAKAATSNQLEIESSKIALKNASAADVKQFAEQMIDDHTKAGNDLKATVVKANVAGGKVPETLDADHQSKLDALAGKSGSAFDTAYIAEQKAAHDDAVTLFSSYASNGGQADLKAFAEKTLPTLKLHQQHVATLAGGASTTTSSVPPLPGANSFTEAQAKDRIEKAGYAEVVGLAKDDNGIWKARAKKGGDPVEVDLDFKGNVVSK